MSSFSKDTLITLLTRGINFILALGVSIIIARVLGPKGKGVYSLTLLLPSTIVTFLHMGVNLATVYYAAQSRYPLREILGTSIWLACCIGIVGIIAGTIIILYFQERIVPGIPRRYLFLAITMIPSQLFFSYLQHLLLGIQRIRAFNVVSIAHTALTFLFIAITVWLIESGVMNVLVATMLSWFLSDAIVLHLAIRYNKGIDFSPNVSYAKKALTYGAQAHLGNIFWDLTHRIDLFLVNGYLSPTEVGLYSIGVAIAEQLWMLSQAASTILLPRVAAENNEEKRRSFTPVITRTVLWFTALGSLILAAISRWLVGFLYSEAFLDAVRPLQILLFGIVALSAGRVLGNDIAGRGHPILNTYVTAIAVVVNIGLNIMLIPRYDIAGAACASSVAYSFILLARLFLYCRLSGNSWLKVVLLQPDDWKLFLKTLLSLRQWAKTRNMC